VEGSGEEAAAMAWLGAFRLSRFAFDFAAEVLREKLAARDPVLRRSDYEAFVDQQAPFHANLAALSESTRERLRQALLRMLREAGLLGPGPDFGTVQRPVLSPRARHVITADDARWLAGFLVPDPEIGSA
jgi:hypothetical protein